MSVLRWAMALLRRLASTSDEADILAGDLEEAHHTRVRRRGPLAAAVVTSLETLDVALMLTRRRLRLPRPPITWLDLRLAARMLLRYPVLTLVGGGALAFAIAIGAVVFALISLILWPALPLPEGDRLVGVRLYDEAGSFYEDRITPDFLRWRGQVSSLVDLGAGRSLRRNLTTADGVVQQVAVEEVTASTFDTAGVAPVMGRALTIRDADPAAPPVVVIGARLWRDRFAANPAVVGTTVVLGETPTAVVGVMPPGFAFPLAQEAWVPLRLDEAAAPRSGASLQVWGRLKDGFDLARARAELAALGAQAGSAWPATHARLRPEVAPFAESTSARSPGWRLLVGSVNLVVGLFIFLITSNVALLMLARAATREPEIIVRTALGASRRRVILQFFSEALVLSALALVVGLIAARTGFARGLEVYARDEAVFGRAVPFWFSRQLPGISIVYACGLALLSALITGVWPALKVTRGLSSRLRRTNSGGGGLEFGGIWTLVIVAQIAVTVTLPMIVLLTVSDGLVGPSNDIGIPPAQLLTARLTRDRDTPVQRFAVVRQVRDELAMVAGAERVTLADAFPFMGQDHWEIDVDAGGAAATDAGLDGRYHISATGVDPQFFAAFDAAPLAGRLLTASDVSQHARVAVANESFVRRVLGGRNPVGRHIRLLNRTGLPSVAPSSQPWIEVVGLVRDLAMAKEPDPHVAGVYVPVDVASRGSILIGVRLAGGADEAAVASALTRLTARTDATLRVTDVQTLERFQIDLARETRYFVGLMTALSLSGLTLSLTGIYSVMSFAVSRRTREIGIRVALGSTRARVVLLVLRRPLRQVAAGVVLGAALISALSDGGLLTPHHLPAFGGYVVLMFGVCLLASVTPVRRAIGVDPIAALRAE